MLYIVSTPIGNLGDFSRRAIDVLKSVDKILCEDTRVTARLLAEYEIQCPLLAFHSHNEHRKLTEVLALLSSGTDLALVSDAGTPGVSDPGYLLIRGCIKEGIEFTVIPGANAVLPALLLSGFPCDRFYFEGFLPHKKGRQKAWKRLEGIESTIVLYESPYRIFKCLEEIRLHFGESQMVALVKEITKIHETVYRGTVGQLIERKESIVLKGEFVVVIDRNTKKSAQSED